MEILPDIPPIQLDEKREVSILSLYQWRTYRNLLCGFPIKKMNEGIIKYALTYAKKNLIEAEKIFLMKPKETPIKLNKKLPYGEPAKIPGITCIAEITYKELLNDKIISDIRELNPENMMQVDYKYFEFGVVWFQNDFSMPIAAHVLEKFKNTEWKI